ncbi:MAG: Lrp/AsnC family transcriptional regulator [Lachnospiraceae bacterium]|nr:Lrp/AsnC family transcriptional regulator [Lachnospiraceae bacterium]
MDEIDQKIIRILAKDARTSAKEIAAQVFLSSPAVANRIRRLEEEGIITGYHAQVNYVQLGYNIKAFINLEVEPKDKKDFYPYIKKIPNVIECSCVTGDYSMLIEGVFRYTEELDHLINELQRFGRTKTLMAFSTSVEHRPIPLA